MDLALKIYSRILDNVTGFDFWFLAFLALVTVTAWQLLGAKKPEKRILKRRIALVSASIVVGIAVLVIHRLIPPERFPPQTAGILVLRIAGDDSANLLQNALVSKLNAQIATDPVGQGIEIWAVPEYVDETRGIVKAHEKARRIGKKRNALLVIWGNKAGEMEFFPRITIPSATGPESERTLNLQDMHQLSLPKESVDEPVYLAHFIMGYALCCYGRFPQALGHIDAAQQLNAGTQEDTIGLEFLAALCHCALTGRPGETETHALLSIEGFSRAAEYSRRTGDLDDFATAENDLGVAYLTLQTGDLLENSSNAITAFQQALAVRTEKDSPASWAETEANLGYAYFVLPTGDPAENAKLAIQAYEAALRVQTERTLPFAWAATEDNLGGAYLAMAPNGEPGEIMKAIVAFHAALRVFNPTNSPAQWAKTQSHLALAYSHLKTDDVTENAKQAISAYQAALSVETEASAPLERALTLNNLAETYRTLPFGDQAENVKKAIEINQAALRVFTEEHYPEEWAMIQHNLGMDYGDMPNGDCVENLKRAVAALENSRRVVESRGLYTLQAHAEQDLQEVKDRLRELQ